MSIGAILLCAGQGKRLGADVPKALVPLAGRPLFSWSLDALECTDAIEGIVVVGATRKLQQALEAAGIHPRKVIAWCEGGRERRDSVAKGLAALPEAFDVVAVHDAARALVQPELIARVAADALQHGAAIAAVPLDDTLKRSTLRVIEATVPRAGLWRAQTPQIFRRDWLQTAHAEIVGKATDDAALVESLGHPVHLTPGDSTNLKITTPADLEIGEALLARR